jgi:hypothetical protein
MRSTSSTNGGGCSSSSSGGTNHGANQNPTSEQQTNEAAAASSAASAGEQHDFVDVPSLFSLLAAAHRPPGSPASHERELRRMLYSSSRLSLPLPPSDDDDMDWPHPAMANSVNSVRLPSIAGALDRALILAELPQASNEDDSSENSATNNNQRSSSEGSIGRNRRRQRRPEGNGGGGGNSGNDMDNHRWGISSAVKLSVTIGIKNQRRLHFRPTSYYRIIKLVIGRFRTPFGL